MPDFETTLYGGRPRILVVDDNTSIHEDYRKILAPAPTAREGLDRVEASLFGVERSSWLPRRECELDSAFQGQEALEKVRAAVHGGRPYSMAFMDVRMPPGWDGVETTVRLWGVDPDLQVVLCTAYADYSMEDLSSRLGHSDRFVILKKPFDVAEVRQLANALTRKRLLEEVARRKLEHLERLAEERLAALAQAEDKYRALFENLSDGVFQRTPEGRYLLANPALAHIFGCATVAEFMQLTANGDTRFYSSPAHVPSFRRRAQKTGEGWHHEAEILCRDGTRRWISERARLVQPLSGGVPFWQGIVTDITARKRAEQERDRMEVQLRHAQKLESVGQLAAGIAHEINTPIQYVGDNLRFLQDAFQGLSRSLAQYQRLGDAVEQGTAGPGMVAATRETARAADLAYLDDEIPKSIKESLEGIHRTARIVGALKEFSHPGDETKTPVDLNRAIDSTLTVSRNEWKYVAELELDFDPSLPPVPCFPSELNQVILNLVINATHAISEVVGDRPAKGRITVRTRADGDWVEIRVEDTGTGIPEAIRDRVFDPFFTTKPVGKGTGQGLSIAHSVVVDKHGGTIRFETRMGKGTVFIVRLPLSDSKSKTGIQLQD